MRIPNNYIESFEKFVLGENEYLLNLLQGNDNFDYPFGYLFGKLSEREPDLLGLIEDIEQNKFHEDEFKKFISSLERANNIKEAESLAIKIKEYEKIEKRDYISLKKLEFITAHLKDLDFEKTVKYYSSIYRSLSEESNLFNCTVDEYVAFNAVKLMYQYYCQSKKRFVVPENNKLEQTYLSKGISLKKIDSQYSKHKLLTIDENFTLSDSNNIPKVYDRRIEEYVLINEISSELMDFFRSLMKQDLIGSIALRPEYSLSGVGISDLSITLEELERGEVFSFENLGEPSVTKLYSKDYDTLWIAIDERNITFEEILQNFDVYDDSIVTQVVHLEYEKSENSEHVIAHIDHEYIFYTEDEFLERQGSYKQKGNARKRYKTFKIDGSKIPFLVGDVCVLYYIIGKFFKEQELLEEYFEEVLKT
ncbi:hypothetical protein [Vreelandella venusta]|uniref:hypothetical protein n=1 Tax=Vreelandella venusta TaxID=44935 RepID=UPI0018DAC33D|nr:hypothetical protein [Halomonas venusta]QPI65532.1 hypothetical protein IR195_07480 [Halomonas venusta]